MEAPCDGTGPIPTSRRQLGTETRTIGRWCCAWGIYLHRSRGSLILALALLLRWALKSLALLTSMHPTGVNPSAARTRQHSMSGSPIAIARKRVLIRRGPVASRS
jgi:hypothetical protein